MNNRLRNVLLLSLLLVFGFLLSLRELYNEDKVLLLLTDDHRATELSSYKYEPLLQGEKISGDFYAKFNYLGTIGVRFWNFYRLNDDYIKFRLKEYDSNTWLYENSYKSDQFPAHNYFTFGFPIINNSKGIHYYFEVESTLGKEDNAVGLSPLEPAWITKYKYPRSLVTSSLSDGVNFLVKKTENLLSKPKFVIKSIIYFLPLITFLLIKILRIEDTIFFSNFLRKIQIWIKSKIFPTLIVVTLIFLDTIVVSQGDIPLMIIPSVIFVLILKKLFPHKGLIVVILVEYFISFIQIYSGGINGKVVADRAMSWCFVIAGLVVFERVVQVFFHPIAIKSSKKLK